MREKAAPDLSDLIPQLAARVESEARLTARRPELVGDLLDASVEAMRSSRPYLAAALSNARRAVQREDYDRATREIRHAAQLAVGSSRGAA